MAGCFGARRFGGRRGVGAGAACHAMYSSLLVKKGFPVLRGFFTRAPRDNRPVLFAHTEINRKSVSKNFFSLK
jgi:hypothetical protein